MDPQGLFASLAIGSGLLALGRLLSKSTGSNTTQASSSAVVAPTVAAPPAVPIVPTVPAPSAIVAPPVPAVLAVPTVAAVIITWKLACLACDRLFIALMNASLDVAHLTPATHATRLPRVVRRGYNGRPMSQMSTRALCEELRRMWTSARKRGQAYLGLGDYDVDFHRAEVAKRCKRTIRVVPAGDTRWDDRDEVKAKSCPDSLFYQSKMEVERKESNTAKASDFYFENVLGFRGDTSWAADYFCAWYKLAFDHGADTVQAKYMAASACIDIICVSHGINPHVGVAGVAPEDFGYVVPTSLPNSFH